MHQSLWKGGENAFHDASDPRCMSRVFKSYLAGQMKALPEILPFLAPTVNSYKRLVDGSWAPTKVTWGVDNRTVAFRVIPGSPKSTRVEVRVSGSDINPYLSLAASLAAGLYGIQKELPLGDAPALAREILGDEFVDHFAATREWEWRQFQDAVTDWELRRYFEVI
jgi:glutamine synthetase